MNKRDVIVSVLLVSILALIRWLLVRVFGMGGLGGLLIAGTIVSVFSWLLAYFISAWDAHD